MRFDWWTFGLQIVNFAVLVWLLRYFLYKPALRLLDARREEIDSRLAEAETAQTSAKEALAAIEAERAGIASEREAAFRAVAVQAEEAARARRAQAESEAAALLEGTRRTLATEREKALAEARKAALDLGVQFARRLLAAAPATSGAGAWLEQIERYLSALPKAEIDGLVRQLDHGGGLRVVTASPLASETADAWRARLRRSLGDGIAVDFDTNLDLIAGAELHFPNAVLRFSWQSALADMRSEIAANAQPR